MCACLFKNWTRIRARYAQGGPLELCLVSLCKVNWRQHEASFKKSESLTPPQALKKLHCSALLSVDRQQLLPDCWANIKSEETWCLIYVHHILILWIHCCKTTPTWFPKTFRARWRPGKIPQQYRHRHLSFIIHPVKALQKKKCCFWGVMILKMLSSSALMSTCVYAQIQSLLCTQKMKGKKRENLRKGENILWFNCLENYPVKIKHAWSSRLSSHFLNNRGRDTTFHPEVLKLFFPKHLCSFPSIVYWSLVLHWEHISWFQKPGNAC